MRTARQLFLLLNLIPFLLQAQQLQETKPEILILTTGGTIASRTDAPLIAGPALVQAVPELEDHADVSVEEFSVIGFVKDDTGALAWPGKKNQRPFR